MRIMLTRTVLLAALLFLVTSGANAATLNVSGGQLLGASGVDVGGTLYNVEFLDGTCIALFDGCDAVSDFTFQTESGAVAASQALLDLVFLDVSGSELFDSAPSLTNGCGDPFGCAALTVHGPIDSLGGAVAALNGDDQPLVDVVITGVVGDDMVDLTGNNQNVYAVWTPVPVPEPVPSIHPIALYTLLPSLLGGAGLVAMKRRSKSVS